MSLRATPQYSFVVPVRNGEKTLAGTLDSIQRQTLRDFEVIVVDNGSTDGTKLVAQQFPGVRYFFLKKRGRSYARNRGSTLARGSRLAFVDADVLLAPDWLEEAHRYLKKIPLDALATKVEPFLEGKSPLDSYRKIFGSFKSQNSFLSVLYTDRAIPLINTAACIVNKTAFEKVGRFDTSLIRHEDRDLSVRLFEEGFVLGGSSSACAKVRFMAASGNPAARELSYLWRAFEVPFYARSNRGAKVNGKLLQKIWDARDPKLLAYGLAVETFLALGRAAHSLLPPVSERKRTKPPRSSLKFSFRHGNEIHLLKKNVRLIFVDEEIHVLLGTKEIGKIRKTAARALRKLYQGEMAKKEINQLLKLGIFQGFSKSGSLGIPFRPDIAKFG